MRRRWLATGLVTVVTVFAEDRTGGRSKKTSLDLLSLNPWKSQAYYDLGFLETS